MIEKIEITQRFNFKRLNRHYECFTIDFVNKNAYYKISERGSGDKFLDESALCDNTWISILVDLRSKMTSKIYPMSDAEIDAFLKEFDNLDLFKDFKSEKFSYFEKLELIYSCNVIIYSTDNYEEYSFKNNFPKNWIDFARLLQKLFDFDVLHLNHQKKLVTPLFHEIKKDGVYKDDLKLPLKILEFGHFRCYPYDVPRPNFIIDFTSERIDGYMEQKVDVDVILNLLEKYGVYLWIMSDYQLKSRNHELEDVEGYDWYLEMVFEGDVIWHLFGYNEYPDTYTELAREIIELCGLDLLELNTISSDEIKLFEKYCVKYNAVNHFF